MQRAVLLIALGLLFAACGGEGSESSPAIEAPGTSAPATTAASPATPVPFDGPPAPDFVLALENRPGDFVLSAEPNPVYLVFWAEW